MEKLTSPELDVLVDPGQGADIVSVVPARLGANLLFASPWSGSPAAFAPPVTGDSWVDWHTRYRGGWQVLCPNAGAERRAYGTVWGFHGEAALVPWQVTDAGETSLTLETELTSAPLRLRRTVEVSGPALRVTEHLTNLAPVPIETHWMHHPAFGHPLIDKGTRISANARRLLADEEAPGPLLEPGAAYVWPLKPVATLPGCDEPRAVFGCLTDFPEHATYTIANPALDLAVRVGWPSRTWPHAWLWQELHGSTGFPWYGRGHACAIEPSSTIPGVGEGRGQTLPLAAGQTREGTIELTVLTTGASPSNE